jgi:TolB-like protein
VVTVKLPISRLGFGLAMEIKAKIPINGLLESTGRRIMLFGRLIDEYSSEVLWSPQNEDSEIFEVKSENKTTESKTVPQLT